MAKNNTNNTSTLIVNLYTEGEFKLDENFPYDYTAGYEEYHFYYVINTGMRVYNTDVVIKLLQAISKHLIFKNDVIAHDVIESFVLAINDIEYRPMLDVYREYRGNSECFIQYIPETFTVYSYQNFIGQTENTDAKNKKEN